jgi:hypothetical protein
MLDEQLNNRAQRAPRKGDDRNRSTMARQLNRYCLDGKVSGTELQHCGWNGGDQSPLGGQQHAKPGLGSHRNAGDWQTICLKSLRDKRSNEAPCWRKRPGLVRQVRKLDTAFSGIRTFGARDYDDRLVIDDLRANVCQVYSGRELRNREVNGARLQFTADEFVDS